MASGNDEGPLEERIEAFWDSNAGIVAEATRRFIREQDPLRKIAGELELDVFGTKALDAGTGAGYSAVSLARMGARVTAIDVSEKMLQQARALSEEYGTDIDFVKADASCTGLPKASFDLVVAKDLLFTCAQPQRVMHELASLIRPGGHLLLFDGNYFSHLSDIEFGKRNLHFLESTGKDEIFSRGDIAGMDRREVYGLMADLPLTGVRRPSWDVSYILDLGLRDIRMSSFDRSSYVRSTDEGPMGLVRNFCLSARMPTGISSIPVADPVSASRDRLSMTNAGDITGAGGVMQALSGTYRLKIATALLRSPMTVNMISRTVDLPQNTTSYNLRILRDAGIVTTVRNGTYVEYALADRSDVLSILRAASNIHRRGGESEDPL